MGIRSNIGYIDSSANPFRGCEGCELWNPKLGVKVCYAGRMISRWAGGKGWPEEFTKPIFVPGTLEKTYNWSDLTGTSREDKPWLNGYPRIINDMSDSFMRYIWKRRVLPEWTMEKQPLSVDWLTDYMSNLMTSSHIYMLLTKRPARAVEFFKYKWGRIPSNFWVGTSVTGPAPFGRALELARLAPHCVGKLWLSLEPLYNKVNLSDILPSYDWVVVGGESGSSPTVTNRDVFSRVVDDCIRTDTPLFIKQLGSGQGYGSKGED